MIVECAYRVTFHERGQFMSEHAGAWVYGNAPYGVYVCTVDGTRSAMVPYCEESAKDVAMQSGIEAICKAEA